ncbi:MAG: tRNA(Ile)-lysidine synthase [Myxococcales bacterium]|nr:tRNA(Ile)-lysidine synthase [Myxococcales bacterium]
MSRARVTPALLTIAKQALTGDAKVARGEVLLAAVSGGPDSMALLHVLARLAPPLGIVVHAHGVDHGLRPEAKHELDIAEAFAKHVGVPFARTALRVARGGNLQARARAARFEALAIAARAVGARTIAMAHHADDRAETVLIRLMRGSGPRGLAVLPARAPLARHDDVELVRPFLRARRDAVLAHIDRHAIPFSTDPSNADPRYLRVRVRREVMPLLEELAPGIVDHLVALADQLGPTSAESGGAFPLSRSVQAALAQLVRSRSTTARVWLPGGLVVTLDPRARPPNSPAPSARTPQRPRGAREP